jgi:ribosome maturation factor RimP
LLTDIEEKQDERIGSLASTMAVSMGVEVVNIDFRRRGEDSLLRIDIDRSGARGVTIDDCRKFSLALEIALDALEQEKTVDQSYTLEVSSPGIDRPITTDDDVRRNTGRKVSISIDTSDSTRTIVGTLLGLEDGRLKILSDESNKEETFSWAEVVHATQYLPF